MLLLIPRRFLNLTVIVTLFNVLFSTAAYAQTGSWSSLTNTAPHYNDGVMLLLPNGNVIAKTSSGGSGGYGTKWDMLTPVNGSYINGTWTTIAAMANPRLYFSSWVLPDGRVYVCGGEYGAGGTSGEIYNPATNTWTTAGGTGHVFPNTISDANSEILPDGKILQASVDETGINLNYLWDPATNTYTAGPNCLRIDNEAVWVKLKDSSVLFLDNYGETSERYIPSTNTWINDATAPVNLYDTYLSEAGAGFTLPDGRVFFIGSTPTSLYYTPSGTTSPGTWAEGPALPNFEGAADAAAAMMPNGHILLTLSPTPFAVNNFPSPTWYYDFDYTTNTFTQISVPGGGGDTTSNACYISNMLDLPDGTVLFANQGDDQYYEYTPGSAALAAGQPTISAVNRVNCDTFQATGLLFNGITEGAAYGDDWQMSTNYPIVRLASGTNVYYATTYNWNRIGAVLTGNAPDTTYFKLPAGLAAGVYSVTVVVNGNPSTPFILNTNLTISPAPVTLCIGDTATLSDVATFGTWSSANSAVATVNTVTGLVTGIASGTTNISYSEGSCYSLANVTVSTGAPTILPIVGAPSVCTGQTTTLTDGTTGGTWSSSNAAIGSVSTGGIVRGITSGTAIITYSYSNSCGTATTSATMTINESTPVDGITGTLGVCQGNTTVLSDATDSGVWSSSNISIATVSTSGIVTGVSAGSSLISYTITNALGCTSHAATTVSVAAPFTANIIPAGSTTFCTGGSVLLNATTGAGYTYQWQLDGVSIPGATSASYPASAAGNYNVVIDNPVGCRTATSNIVVDVTSGTITVPTLSISGSHGTSICSGASPSTFSAVAVNGGSTPAYEWFVNGTLVGSGATYTYSPANGDIVKCVLASSAPCSVPDTASSSLTVNILPLETPSVSAVSTPVYDSLCAGDTVQFGAVSVYGGTAPSYQWLINRTDVASGSSYSTAALHNGDTLTVIMVSNYQCLTTPVAESRQYIINVIAPTVNELAVTVSQSSIILGNVDTFTAVASGAGSAPSFQWYIDGVPVAGATQYRYITDSLKEGQVVNCKETSSFACADPYTVYSGGFSVTVLTNGVKQIGYNPGDFSIMPNPNEGVFTVKGTLVSSADNRVDIVITDVLGRVIYKKTAWAGNSNVNEQISLPNTTAPGTYQVSVTSGEQHAVFHIVVEK